MLGTLSFGHGATICGVGLLANGLLCAAGRLPSGNVQASACWLSFAPPLGGAHGAARSDAKGLVCRQACWYVGRSAQQTATPCPPQVQAWELLADSRELQVLPTVSAPGTLWDALQGMVGKAALAGAPPGGRGWVCGCGAGCTG